MTDGAVFVNGVGWLIPHASAINHGLEWTAEDLAAVMALYHRYDLWTVASLLGRTGAGVRHQAQKMGMKFLSLQDQRPKPDTRGRVA